MPELPEDVEYRRQVLRTPHALPAMRRDIHGSGFAGQPPFGKPVPLGSASRPGWITIDYREGGGILSGAIFSIALATCRIGIQIGKAIGDSGHGRLRFRQPAT